MNNSMFRYDAAFTAAVFEYCRDRLALDPVPLDLGSYGNGDIEQIASMITDAGMPAEGVLAYFRDQLAERVISIDSPGFLAFIPNAPTKNALLFDMVVACSGLNGTSWLEAAGAVVAENHALTYLATRAGLPAGAGGAFVSGGTIANLSALAVAREVGRAKNALRPDVTLRIAMNEEAHSSVGRALYLLGVEPVLVPAVDHRLTLDALRASIEGHEDPDSIIGVVATGGTTNAGIIDDLEAIGSFAQATGRWFHVDAAYGGAALFSPTHAQRFEGLRHADSFVVDPHKWLFAPLDCAALIYRNPHLARRVHTQEAGYLDVLHQDEATHYEWNPSDFAIHLSRRARGLPFWFSLVTYGVAAYERAVQAGIDLARFAAVEIKTRDDLELIREPELSVVLFRRRGWSEADYNEWSEQLLRQQIAFVTPTKWEGETVARIAFLHPDTTEKQVVAILDSMSSIKVD